MFSFMRKFSSILFIVNLFFCTNLLAHDFDKDSLMENYNTGQLDKDFYNAWLQDSIKNKLGSDYANFYSNIQETGTVYKLKDGGVYYEGWGLYQYRKIASAIVVYPDGEFYAVYVNPITKNIIYKSNMSNCNYNASKSLRVFVNQLDSKFVKNKNNILSALFKTCEASSKSLISLVVVADNPAQAKARAVAASIWGNSLADGWTMNQSVGDVLGQAINQINTCSANFRLVPKPVAYFSTPGLLYFLSYGLQVVSYNSALRGQTVYKTCITSVALQYRTAIELASLGL